MDKFQAIRAFREVALQGGFAAAARQLNISTPSVSRLVSELEADLGTRLFNRTTRSVSLTEEGERFLRRGVGLFDELEAVSVEIRDRQQHPRGHLRISSVVAFGQERLAPAIVGFMTKYPYVTVDLHISNRTVDLVEEHFDLAIRIGGMDGLENSNLKSRKIFSQEQIFVATPEYLSRKGRPENLDEVLDHIVAKQISGSWGRVNEFRKGNERIVFQLPDAFVVNSPIAARNAVLTGECLGLLADYLVEHLIADGRLVRVLPNYATAEQPIFAIFAHRNYMPAKIRAFIDYIAEAAGQSDLAHMISH